MSEQVFQLVAGGGQQLTIDELRTFYARLGVSYSEEQLSIMMIELTGIEKAPLTAHMLSTEYCQKELASEESFQASFAVMNEAGALESPGALRTFLQQLGETVTIEEANAMLDCAHRFMPKQEEIDIG
jgi:Ca2+-binding EF-hand superfamily protein